MKLASTIKSHLNLPFEVFDPYSDNLMRPRTQSCISLLPTGNLSGSAKVLSLLTGKPIVRDQFTILPCTDTVISRMNELADMAVARLGADSSELMSPDSDESEDEQHLDESHRLRLYADDTVPLDMFAMPDEVHDDVSRDENIAPSTDAIRGETRIDDQISSQPTV